MKGKITMLMAMYIITGVLGWGIAIFVGIQRISKNASVGNMMLPMLAAGILMTISDWCKRILNEVGQ